MHTTTPRVPAWWFLVTGLSVTALLGALLHFEVAWPAQVAVVLLLLLGLTTATHRRSA